MSTSRRQFLHAVPAVAALSAAHGLGGPAQQPEQLAWCLWYRQPAQRWLDALPTGNGRLGAMLFGGVSEERIALNESTLWSGAPNSSSVHPEARDELQHIRELLFNGHYAEGNELAAKLLCGREGSYGTHLPMADILLRTADAKPFAEYRRSLNLQTGIARVEYQMGSHRFVREMFASHPNQVLVVRLTAEAGGELSFALSIDPGDLRAHVQVFSPDMLLLTGSAWETKHSDGAVGVNFGAYVRVLNRGGTVSAIDDVIHVTRADSVTMLVAANTNYREVDFHTLGRSQIERASSMQYAELRERHVSDHQSLFNRVQVDFGGLEKAQTAATDERLKALRSRAAADPHLAAQFLQYARYLLIAGSREDSPLPLNLQGIWNDGLAARMGWTCDFHLDINTQQNYWPVESCNLPGCGDPLFRYVSELRSAGRSTARELYGAPGWVCHVYGNVWGFTAPGRGLDWGIFPTGGAWIAMHLWSHYEYTRDETFLRRDAYPILKEAAEFFLGYLVREPHHGWLVSGPSISPENRFLAPNGERCSVSMGPTVDRVIVFALLSACLEAARELHVDENFRARVEAACSELSPLLIGKHGQLQEWLHDFDEAEPNHRHTSHLLALFPFAQITPERTPELAKAAEVTIARRTGQKDWEDVEWSRANLINYFARLQNAEKSHHHLLGLLTEDTDNNLLTFSRGGVAGAEQNIFAIDGNTAGAAGICEMLLQSHNDIHLLPALPSAWPTGAIKGLRARGGFQVDIQWTQGVLQSATVRSNAGGSCVVRFRSHTANITLKPQQSRTLDGSLREVTI